MSMDGPFPSPHRGKPEHVVDHVARRLSELKNHQFFDDDRDFAWFIGEVVDVLREASADIRRLREDRPRVGQVRRRSFGMME